MIMTTGIHHVTMVESWEAKRRVGANAANLTLKAITGLTNGDGVCHVRYILIT